MLLTSPYIRLFYSDFCVKMHLPTDSFCTRDEKELVNVRWVAKRDNASAVGHSGEIRLTA